jgi:signal transduction histidine kinase
MNERFDRVLLVRHFAICAGAGVAYLLRAEQIGNTALWIVGIGSLLNAAAFAFRTRPNLAKVCELASPVIGVGSWGALVGVTGGVASPFMAGLWLEIALSAMAMRPPGILYVSAGSIAALWIQQIWVGIAGAGTALVLQTGFMIGMGCAIYLVTRRWTGAQRALASKHDDLAFRLDSLETELASERALGRLGDGENVGRLAHGLKNAVHSLRGFTSLIERKVLDPGEHQALAGLRAAIDDLETLARLTLDEGREADPQEADGLTRDAMATVERAIRAMSQSAPGVRWSIHLDGERPSLRIPDGVFRYLLDILMRNAVEAMQGSGRASVDLLCARDFLRVRIHDRGCGLSDDALRNLFKPGYTTKAHGSGYGLFLALRIAREHAGSLEAESLPGEPGAIFELRLPLSAEPASKLSAEPASKLSGEPASKPAREAS